MHKVPRHLPPLISAALRKTIRHITTVNQGFSYAHSSLTSCGMIEVEPGLRLEHRFRLMEASKREMLKFTKGAPARRAPVQLNVREAST
jgi:hypothetical protein